MRRPRWHSNPAMAASTIHFYTWGCIWRYATRWPSTGLPGVRELHRLLQARHRDVHRAEHVLMEALGEALWESQRDGRPPDEGRYLALARRQLMDKG